MLCCVTLLWFALMYQRLDRQEDERKFDEPRKFTSCMCADVCPSLPFWVLNERKGTSEKARLEAGNRDFK